MKLGLSGLCVFGVFMVVVKLDCVFCSRELLNAYFLFMVYHEADSDRGSM